MSGYKGDRMFKNNTRILILDDMSTMRKIVTKALKDLGFVDIQEAVDGNQGWALLEKAVPPIELIISDWNMPNCTGLELLKKVRADQRYGKIPFILLTAEAEASQILDAVKSGVSNYIVKPFSLNTFKEKLEQTHTKIEKLAG